MEISSEHQLLLNAILSTDDKAEIAWNAWSANFDFDKSGPRFFSLIPLLYQKLKQLNIDNPLLGKFKGIHRRVWYNNQLQIRQICEVLEVWQHFNIEAICLTDISLAAQYYADIGIRPIHLRFLVPSSKIHQAIYSLQNSGWRLKEGMLLDNLVDTTSQCRLIHKDMGDIYLRWHLFSKNVQPITEERFWNAKQPFEIQNVSTYVLNPTDQLFYTCIQGRYQHKSPLWVVDALTLLRHPQSNIDWARFKAHCRHDNHLHRTARKALAYLASTFKAPIPSTVLKSRKSIWSFFKEN